MSEECINDLAVALRDQLILVDDLRDQLEEAKANHENAVAHMQSVCAERDHLKTLLIEREAVRIGQGLKRHDDQKQIDELVAIGIQQDKDEIASLKEENGDLKFALQLIMAEGGTAGAIAYQAIKELES